MAKPTKYAPHLCTLFMVIAIIGVGLGFIFQKPFLTILLLIPTAVYEAYRTEGKSTTAASYLLVILLLAELVLVIFDIDVNIAEFLGRESEYIAGYLIPLGDLRIVGPAIIAVLAVILFTRTRGVYTRWLAVVIFVSSFAIVYLIDPVVFQELLRFGIEQAAHRF